MPVFIWNNFLASVDVCILKVPAYTHYTVIKLTNIVSCKEYTSWIWGKVIILWSLGLSSGRLGLLCRTNVRTRWLVKSVIQSLSNSCRIQSTKNCNLYGWFYFCQQIDDKKNVLLLFFSTIFIKFNHCLRKIVRHQPTV